MAGVGLIDGWCWFRAVYVNGNLYAHNLLMTFKQLNVKQAERWLEKLKN
jgi:hypothetical protein